MVAKPNAARAATAVQTSTGLSGIDLDVPRVTDRGTAGDVGNRGQPALGSAGHGLNDLRSVVRV